MKYLCLIIDDEPIARNLLSDYIKHCPQLELSGICKNAYEATEMLSETSIDLIFLDINMPQISGIQFYKSLSNPPYVIFTTAYSEYAVEGFELDAIDYLLKPFPLERFIKAVNKAVEIIQQKQHVSRSKSFLLFRADRKVYRIAVDEVSRIQAIGDYVKIFFSGKFILVHEPLKTVLAKFPDATFVQVHKSHAVALPKIEMVDGNTIKVSGDSVPVGQSFKQSFFSRLK